MPLDVSHADDGVATAGHSFPLSEARRGARLRIVGVAAGLRLERRLQEMGLPRGTEVEVVDRLGRRGAVVLSAHGGRLAVGAGVADKIRVVTAAG